MFNQAELKIIAKLTTLGISTFANDDKTVMDFVALRKKVNQAIGKDKKQKSSKGGSGNNNK